MSKKPTIKVVDDVTPYGLIKLMNVLFKDVKGYKEKPTQYGYSARKSGTVKSFKSPEGKWMITAANAQDYFERYYNKNLAPDSELVDA